MDIMVFVFRQYAVEEEGSSQCRVLPIGWLLKSSEATLTQKRQTFGTGQLGIVVVIFTL